MNITQKNRDENNETNKNNNNTTINEKTAMLEVSQAIIRPIKRDCFKYKYHLIFSSIIIIIFVVIILNIAQIKIFFKEKNLEHNVMRNFSEIDLEPKPPTPVGNESPIYWKNEKKIAGLKKLCGKRISDLCTRAFYLEKLKFLHCWL